MNITIPTDIAKKMAAITSMGSFRPTPISHWLSGDAAFSALKQAVEELTRSAPEDCDVLIRAFNITVREVRYVKPHTLLFRGLTDDGHDTWVVCHFSQLVAQVVYLPKAGPSRVITGFANGTA
jgi:hypothetical protein